MGDRQAIVSFTAPSNNGGSPITGYTVTASPGGATASHTSSPITVTGLTNGTTYTFTVKATNSAGGGSSSTPSSPVTPSAATYTVTFNSQGGTAVPSITNVASGSKISRPTSPTRAGYTFVGWYREAAGTTAWNFDSDIVTANTTLYAKWQSTSAATYTVTFNPQGGTAVLPITNVVSGSKISSPTSPARTGYTFVGWYREAAGTTAWNFNSDIVTANITLYARWQSSGGGNSGGGSGNSGGGGCDAGATGAFGLLAIIYALVSQTTCRKSGPNVL
jgi:uncharacterized repeat protein (TIGR02543 family)